MGFAYELLWQRLQNRPIGKKWYIDRYWMLSKADNHNYIYAADTGDIESRNKPEKWVRLKLAL